jgi:hypothetical protein
MIASRPILFSAPMVRALLDGTKTQTRRVVKPTQSTPKVAPLTMEPWLIEMNDGTFEHEVDDRGLPCWLGTHPDYPGDAKWFSCPYGAPGDLLWVRETWAQNTIGGESFVFYRADSDAAGPWRPSIFMPRHVSRLTLRITEVRVERLQEISEDDARAEGVREDEVLSLPMSPGAAAAAYSALWDSINGKAHPWDSNPWVWVVKFEVMR